MVWDLEAMIKVELTFLKDISNFLVWIKWSIWPVCIYGTFTDAVYCICKTYHDYLAGSRFSLRGGEILLLAKYLYDFSLSLSLQVMCLCIWEKTIIKQPLVVLYYINMYYIPVNSTPSSVLLLSLPIVVIITMNWQFVSWWINKLGLLYLYIYPLSASFHFLHGLSIVGRREVGANPIWHRASGGAHPGWVANPS